MNIEARTLLPTLEELERTHRDWLYWFTGFFDGEGSLHASLPSAKSMPTIGLQVVQRDDDVQVLQQIVDVFRCGSINLRVEKENSRYRSKATKTYVWLIRDCRTMAQLFIPFFDRFPLRTKKAMEYQFWRELVLLKAADREKSDAKIEQARELVAKIREIRK